MPSSLPNRPIGQITDDAPSAVSDPSSVIALLRGIYANGVGVGVGGGPATIADGADVTFGAKADAAAGTDTATATYMALFKRHLQRITTLIGLLPTALTGSGNFKVAVQEALPAGEAHIGAVGGNSTIVIPTITVSNGVAYSNGDSIGGKLTLTSAIRVSAGYAILQTIQITDRDNQKPTGDIIIFNQNPSGSSTLTDNSAIAIASASTDDLAVVATIPIASADYSTIGSKAYATIGNLGVLLNSTGTTLYAAFNVTSTPTFTSTSALQIRFGFLQD